MKKRLFTLCLVLDKGKILLGKKKKGFGIGKWNGFGGKVRTGETIEEGAKRELKEEAGILAKKLEKQGILRFSFEDYPEELLEVHIFRVSKFEGEPFESEEMRPRWFKLEEVPFDEMWPDDKIWFPLFLKRKKFEGTFRFLNDNLLLEHILFEVSET